MRELPRTELNYFTHPGFLRLDLQAGALHSRGGTRLIAVSDTFLGGVVAALSQEPPGASEGAESREAHALAPRVLRRCGVYLGEQLAQRFEGELGAFAGMALRDRPMAEFDVLMQDLFVGCGLGRLVVDWSRGAQGFLPVELHHSPMSGLLPRGRITDDLLCGILEGLLGAFADGGLRCVQTRPGGDPTGAAFVLAPKETSQRVSALVEQRLDHGAIVARLGGAGGG